MHIAIRADAAPFMGTGHLMRCLTLADAARARGASVRFVCRPLAPYLVDMLQAHGHELATLPDMPSDTQGQTAAMDAAVGASDGAGPLAHAAWLGQSQESDAGATAAALADRPWDWLVVDHYAIDARWEHRLRAGPAERIAVIDDLADRTHACDVLLDQNFYAGLETRYQALVAPATRLLLGPQFVLLRPEFARARRQAAQRRGPVRRLLVFFGGADQDNATGLALEALALAGLAAGQGAAVAVDVVIGAMHPHRAGLATRCDELGFTLHVQTTRMAELMLGADLALGAGGAATWERCALGLPSIVLVLADNQRQAMDDLHAAGVVHNAGPAAGLSRGALAGVLAQLLADDAGRARLSQRSLAMMASGSQAQLVDVLMEERA